MSGNLRYRNENCLDIAARVFDLLGAGPAPVSVDGRLFASLPGRMVALPELRRLLLDRSCSDETRDVVWAYLVNRSRSEGGTWTVAAVGMALPALVRVVAGLSARCRTRGVDVHAEVLQGFLTGLEGIDLTVPRIANRLRWSAYRAGHAAVTAAAANPVDSPTSHSTGLHTPAGHPDLVLARAVDAGVISRVEADLIGATRLERVPIAVWADGHGVTRWAAYKSRDRAETRLAARLRDHLREDDGSDPVATEVLAHIPDPVGPVVVRGGVSKTGSDSGFSGRGTTRSATAKET